MRTIKTSSTKLREWRRRCPRKACTTPQSEPLVTIHVQGGARSSIPWACAVAKAYISVNISCSAAANTSAGGAWSSLMHSSSVVSSFFCARGFDRCTASHPSTAVSFGPGRYVLLFLARLTGLAAQASYQPGQTGNNLRASKGIDVPAFDTAS